MTAEGVPYIVVVAGAAPQPFSLSKAEMTVGRSPDRDIHLDNSEVSRLHATFTRRGGGTFLTDLGSSNGTFVNGTPLTGTIELHDGDQINFASIPVTFYGPSSSGLRPRPPIAEPQSTPRPAPNMDVPPTAPWNPVPGAPSSPTPWQQHAPEGDRGRPPNPSDQGAGSHPAVSPGNPGAPPFSHDPWGSPPGPVPQGPSAGTPAWPPLPPGQQQPSAPWTSPPGPQPEGGGWPQSTPMQPPGANPGSQQSGPGSWPASPSPSAGAPSNPWPPPTDPSIRPPGSNPGMRSPGPGTPSGHGHDPRPSGYAPDQPTPHSAPPGPLREGPGPSRGSPPPPQAALEQSGGPPVLLTHGEIHIGRIAGNDVVLPDSHVSSRHAVIQNQNGQFVLVDLGSSNGTYVNGQRVLQPYLLEPGDEIRIGTIEFIFRRLAPVPKKRPRGGPSTPGRGPAGPPSRT